MNKLYTDIEGLLLTLGLIKKNETVLLLSANVNFNTIGSPRRTFSEMTIVKLRIPNGLSRGYLIMEDVDHREINEMAKCHEIHNKLVTIVGSAFLE